MDKVLELTERFSKDINCEIFLFIKIVIKWSLVVEQARQKGAKAP